MKKSLILIVALSLMFAATTAVMAGDKKPEAKTYYQYGPNNQVLQPGSLWNPHVTEKSDGTVYKSYYQLPDSKATPKGSIWNPLTSTEVKKGK